MFDRMFVINLRQHIDRLSAFMKRLPECLRGLVEVWEAVDGKKVIPPVNWRCSPGMWGAFKSHLGILEHCMQHEIASYLVFEDDCIFMDDFESPLRTYLSALPFDWQQFYLGGQLLESRTKPPRRFNESLRSPWDVNRTHAMAVHRRGYEKLYQHMIGMPNDVEIGFDTYIGQLHRTGQIKVYVPNRWLCGQLGGCRSLTSNAMMPPNEFWCDPEKVNSAYQMQFEPETRIELPLNAVVRES